MTAVTLGGYGLDVGGGRKGRTKGPVAPGIKIEEGPSLEVADIPNRGCVSEAKSWPLHKYWQT
jgi:hypothetical protein